MSEDPHIEDIEERWEETERGIVFETYICREDPIGPKELGILDLMKVDGVGKVIQTVIEIRERGVLNPIKKALEVNKELLESIEQDGENDD